MYYRYITTVSFHLRGQSINTFRFRVGVKNVNRKRNCPQSGLKCKQRSVCIEFCATEAGNSIEIYCYCGISAHLCACVRVFVQWERDMWELLRHCNVDCTRMCMYICTRVYMFEARYSRRRGIRPAESAGTRLSLGTDAGDDVTRASLYLTTYLVYLESTTTHTKHSPALPHATEIAAPMCGREKRQWGIHRSS